AYVLSVGERASGQELTRSLLEKIASFAFCSRAGMHYTARKQKARRGGDYWYAYRRLRGRLVKRYLGKTEDLTLARLEEVARGLTEMSDARESAVPASLETLLPLSGKSVVDAAHPETARRSFAMETLLLSRLSPPRLLTYLRSVLRVLPAHAPDGTPASPLLEPLSPQEKRVLRLLAEHRSNAEIARELVVSVNTVRTQVQSIYGKLGVHKRSAASDVARELRLF
ncbi:MAG TPA: LuxR C-terminal-related transcriptional regulator, partial [Acidobacteriaceae bacterium]|nr:LuxR C-terminal-related transcriptional regulator [Acidobacteriaceae bacterium]